MGYMVSALAAIGEDDAHSLFATFIPTHMLAHQWINDWIYAKFSSLAQALGPDAVVIAPPNAYGERYLNDFRAIVDARDEELLHSGLPLLIISLSPLRLRPQEEQADTGVAVNLAAFPDDRTLSRLFDQLSSQAEADLGDIRDLDIDVPRFRPSTGDEQYWRFAVEEAVQLKPNMFGVGLNLNALAHFWSEKRQGSSGTTYFTF